jgi:hypothetical protein
MKRVMCETKKGNKRHSSHLNSTQAKRRETGNNQEPGAHPLYIL